MTSVPPLKKPGKHPGKQIQDAIATWGSRRTQCRSRRTQCNGELSGGLAPSLRAASVGTFDALAMPKVVVYPLRPSSCCFPHASPVSSSGTGKQNTALGNRSKSLTFLRKSGAGEGIPTLDPNLGKVVQIARRVAVRSRVSESGQLGNSKPNPTASRRNTTVGRVSIRLSSSQRDPESQPNEKTAPEDRNGGSALGAVGIGSGTRGVVGSSTSC